MKKSKIFAKGGSAYGGKNQKSILRLRFLRFAQDFRRTLRRSRSAGLMVSVIEPSKSRFKIQNFGFWFVILIFAFCILHSFGCAGLSKKDTLPKNESLLEPQVLLKFSDIPVPVGFKLLTQDSYTFESVGIRVGMLKYQGNANVEQVVNFYKDQMPLYNWNLLNVIEYGERLLNFDREAETCIVRLLPKGKYITITIALGPRSEAKPKRSDKPVK